MTTSLEPNKALLIYDDKCLLCHSSLQFILKRDHEDQFRMTSFHSSLAKELLDSKMLQTVVLIYQNQTFIKSRAVIKTLSLLGGKWKFLGVILQLFPTFLADSFYNIIAKYRYQWFGKMTKCALPDNDWRKKLIS